MDAAEPDDDAPVRHRGPRLVPDVLLVLLAAGAGATEAVSYLGLGRVLTAVMTGNLVLLGVAAGAGAGAEAVRSVVSLAGYVVGVAVAARFLGGTRADDTHPWPRRVTHAIGVQAAFQVLVWVGWLVANGRPEGVGQAVLVGVSAVAMGFQARSVQALALPAGSTTYLTGTLTTVTGRLAAGGPREGVPRLLALIAAMLAGAAIGALLISTARPAAPLLPLGLTVVVFAAAMVLGRRS
ncbi:DUF1275 family protein [Actinocatenispora rupis]|uniref:DUF1275 domain-containing protein n=1 Tax=Actinocatenispora rupis TaxID=519421 RepID=A0A8J3N7D8_9ACTN|nr:DUF1275 family protein [Actinocatenispora rupis]GID09214.1 hypothetical protein Aru02nite_01030 [Actinocatenispora rupis]